MEMIKGGEHKNFLKIKADKFIVVFHSDRFIKKEKC